MDATQRRDACRLIAGLVVSDDDLDAREDAFLDRLLARFGIPQSERDTIFPIVDRADAAAAMKALPADAQLEAFTLLIAAAVADGKVAPEERAYLEAVATVVGFDAAAIDAAVTAALSAP